MVKVGVEHPATRRRGKDPPVEAVAPPEGPEAPRTEPQRSADDTLAAAPAVTTMPGLGTYRRVFACATSSSDSPDEERPS